MYPYERSLVERYQGRPFTLLGVNSDGNRDRVKQAIEREGITWRSWWAGGMDGPIPRLYRVERWPTMYLIDADGSIRFSGLYGKNLDDAIEMLVREAENGHT